jgi:hypothetical protein
MDEQVSLVDSFKSRLSGKAISEITKVLPLSTHGIFVTTKTLRQKMYIALN